VVSPSGVVERTSEFFTAENSRSQRFLNFSALSVLCGIIEPAFASNTQEGNYLKGEEQSIRA
jgi:hypothetical protein